MLKRGRGSGGRRTQSGAAGLLLREVWASCLSRGPLDAIFHRLTTPEKNKPGTVRSARAAGAPIDELLAFAALTFRFAWTPSKHIPKGGVRSWFGDFPP